MFDMTRPENISVDEIEFRVKEINSNIELGFRSLI